MSAVSNNVIRLPEPQIERATAPGAAPSTSGTAAKAPAFGEVLTDVIEQARALETKADAAATDFAKGEGGIHEVMIAHEKASVAVRYAVTMKNKALEAYREILNTQI